MTTERGRSGVASRRGRSRLLWCAGALLLGGCVGGQGVSLPDTHPASPRATAGSLTASLATTSYQSPADFAARRPATGTPSEAGTTPGGAGGGTGAAETAVHGQAAEHGQAQVAQATGSKPSGVGTINAVNPDRRTVNISHEPMPSIGLPAMTMDLPVAPSVDLRAVQAGSRVTFTLTRGADGLYVIDSIRAATPGAGQSGSGAPAGGGTPGTGSMPGMGHGGMPMPGGQPPAKGQGQ